MHQSGGVLCGDGGNLPLHRLARSVDSHHHHLGVTYAAEEEGCCLRGALHGRGVSGGRSSKRMKTRWLSRYRATGVGVWRIVLLAKGFFPTHPVYDATYSIGFCSSAVEVHVAVLAACAPCLKAIASTYLPRLLGSSRRATYPSTGRQYVPTSTTSYSRRSHVKISAARGDASVAFEMVTPQLPIPGVEEAAHRREMRKYHPYGEDDTSLSSEDGAPTTGIVKTTAISVRYTADSNLESGGEGTREGSVERLV